MSRHRVTSSCVRVNVRDDIDIDDIDIRFRVALAWRRVRCRVTLRATFERRTIFRVEMRTNDVVLRLREYPRRIVIVNVTHIRAQPNAHTFRRDRRVRVVAHDVVMQCFQNDCRRDVRFRVALRDVRFRVCLCVRHFVFRFRHCIVA